MPTERQLYANHLMREHARFTRIAERNMRIANLLTGVCIGALPVTIAAAFLFSGILP